MLEIFLLGQFCVNEGGETVTQLHHARLQELLAYLLLQRRRPVSRSQLAYLFWPDSSEDQARTNLRNLLHRLRKSLPAVEQFLRVDETSIEWRSDSAYFLDVAQFEGAVQQAEAASKSERIELLARAARVYGGNLLPDCYSDWVVAERERLHQSYLKTLSNLAGLYQEQRRYLQAIEAVQALLQADALNESAYALLMQLHAWEGNRGQALHAYHMCAEALRRELGVEPGPALRTLYEQLLKTADLPVLAAPNASLVARQAEWEQLTRRWREWLRSPRSLRGIIITGEAGIGKTHLAEIFFDWVRRQGIRTAAAACYDASRGLAYAALKVWLNEIYTAEKPHIEALPLAIRIEISRLLPEMSSSMPDLPAPAPLQETWQQIHFYQALLRAFAVTARPLLLWLDDLQWCDPETLAWLAYLTVSREAEHILLLITARDAGHNLSPTHEDIFPAQTTIMELALERFDEAESRELAQFLSDAPIPEHIAEYVFRFSEGNPLFITEIVRSGLQPMAANPASYPARVKTVLDGRLKQLSSTGRQVVELGAVIGRSFSYELLQRASPMDEQTLVDGLDECWRHRILRELGSMGYDFSHDQLRRTAYDGLSQARRRLLHGRAAAAFEQVFSANPNPVAEQIARHLELAGNSGRAILFYERAAQEARSLFALSRAILLLEQALSLLPPGDGSRELAARLYEQLGQSLLIQGQNDSARSNFLLAMQHLDPEDAVSRARLWRQTAQAWSAEQRYDEAGESVQNALAELGDLPPAMQEADWRQEWLGTRLQQVDYLYFKNLPDEMETVCRLLEDPLDRFGTLGQKSEFSTLLGMLNNRRERYRISAETVQYVRRALVLAEQTGDRLMIARKQFGLGFNLLWYGDRPAAILQLEQAFKLSEKLGATYVQNQALAYLTIASRMENDKARVEQLASLGLSLARAGNHPTYQGTALANQAWLAYRRGDLELAERLAENALNLWQHGAYPFEWLADLPLAASAAQRGDLKKAQERLAAMLMDSQQRLPGELEASLRDAVKPTLEADRQDASKVVQRALEEAARLGYF